MTPLFSNALLRTQSDERLLLLVRVGTERAFEAIVDRYRRPLQRYCERALTRSRAEDVVQQVFVKAWLALRDGTEVRSLRPWLYRITRTTILETAQPPGYEYDELAQSLSAGNEPESELEQRTVIRKTLAGLAALPEAQREALLRTAVDGQSRAQIAEELGVSEGAVRQLVHRARLTLRAAATAVTPLPLVNWMTTLGQSPAGGSALENGTAGSAGVVGLAKVSAILATAGAVAAGAGPSTVHHRRLHVRKAQAAASTSAHQDRTKQTPIAVREAISQESASTEAGHAQSANQSGHEGEQADSRNPHGAEGDSGSSRPTRGGGDSDRQTPNHEGDRGNGEHAQPVAPKASPATGDLQPGGADSAGSGSGDNGD